MGDKREPHVGKQQRKPVDVRLEIHLMLAVSTANLRDETHRWLDDQIPESEDRNLGTTPLFIVYPKMDRIEGGNLGWFIPIIEDEKPWADKELPQDLREILKYAGDHGCSWLMFDRDADPLPGFKNYHEE